MSLTEPALPFVGVQLHQRKAPANALLRSSSSILAELDQNHPYVLLRDSSHKVQTGKSPLVYGLYAELKRSSMLTEQA